MHLHEYQAKEIIRKYGIAVSKFLVVSDSKAIEEKLQTLGSPQIVVKAQVHAGGRGKAGGVKIAQSHQHAIEEIRKMLGIKIVNAQTGKQGVIASQILLTPLINFTKAYYLAVTIDRARGEAILIASPEGGVDIEEVAVHHPEHIKVIRIAENGCLRRYQHIALAKFMGWQNEIAKEGVLLAQHLVDAFFDTDATLIEINPLVLSEDQHLIALDAKISIDENALFRRPALAAMEDPSQLNPYEAKAREFGLAYIALDGNIGCMVNGAGLAMATMDIIQYYGAFPANFLDVGGGASEDKVAEGFKILLSDPNVKVILINIFGGIMNCVTLASGILAAIAELRPTLPLVVRMEGTEVEKGKKLLMDSGVKIVVAHDLADAAKKAVELSKYTHNSSK